MGIELVTLKKSADVQRMLKEFGIKPIEEIADLFPNKTLIDIGLLIAHRDFDYLLRGLAKGHKFAIVSGRGPSGPLHLGHILVFSLVKHLQDMFNAEVFIPISDDEKFIFGKVQKLEDAEKWAYDNIKYIAALGFDPKKTHIYISSKTPWVYRYALKCARKMTINMIKSALGTTDSHNPGILFYAAVQIAHILQPTFDYDLPVVVPIGLDQDVFMRLARDVAQLLHIKKPASLYVQFLPGPRGEPMSSSKPETALFVNADSRQAWRIIANLFTGGQGSIREQFLKGGNPDVCHVFLWLKHLFFKNKGEIEVYAEMCRSGELICGIDCKPLLHELVMNFLAKLRDAAEKVDIEKFLMDSH